MSPLTLFLGGDVMTGRGVDQALPHPAAPEIFEPAVKSSLGYVELAEAANGPIPRPVDFAYIWGDLVQALDALRPDARIVNLETAITHAVEPDPKGINYKMSPENAACLTTAGLDCCTLANNHVLDWGPAGLEDTLDTLDRLGIHRAGAGRNDTEAAMPAVIETGEGRRVLVFALASPCSGVAKRWAAQSDRPGVNLVDLHCEQAVEHLAERVRAIKRPGDIALASIHWGGNWGHEIPDGQTRFAHALIDRAGVDLIHGHSAHHAKAMEVYRERLILYGCGDLLNDYEGIGGQKEFRGDLVLAFFPALGADGTLMGLDLRPYRIRRFRLNAATPEEAAWLAETLSREGRRFGTRLAAADDLKLRLEWP